MRHQRREEKGAQMQKLKVALVNYFSSVKGLIVHRWKLLLLGVIPPIFIIALFINATTTTALPGQMTRDTLGVTQTLPSPIYHIITSLTFNSSVDRPEQIKSAIDSWHSTINFRLGESPIIHCSSNAETSVLAEFKGIESNYSSRVIQKDLPRLIGSKCVAWKTVGTSQICTKAECAPDPVKNKYDAFAECPLPKVVGGVSGVFIPKGSKGICDCPVGKELRWNAALGWVCVNDCDNIAKVGQPGCSSPCPECPVGNPTMPRDGIKVQREVDFPGTANGELVFYRTFRSGFLPSPLIENVGWKYWYHNYGLHLQAYSAKKDTQDDSRSVRAHLVRDDGSIKIYRKKDSTWLPEDPWDRNRLIEEKLDTSGILDPPRTSWTYINNENDTIERYDRMGQIWYIQDRFGARTYFYYSTAETSTTIAPRPGLLVSVIAPSGNKLRFYYDAFGRLVQVLPPGATTTGTPENLNAPIRYNYNEAASLGVDVPASNQLTKVILPSGLSRKYHYENKVLPSYLTGITDESQIRVGTYLYNSSVSNPTVRQTSQINGSNRVEFNFYPGTQVSIVTDYSSGVAKTSATTYGLFGPKNNKLLPISTSADCPLCGTSYKKIEYTDDLLPEKSIGHDGLVIFKSYDTSRRLVMTATFPASYANATSRPALSAAIEVVGVTYWGSTNLPTQVSRPNIRLVLNYDSNNKLLSQTSIPTADNNGSLVFSSPASKPALVEVVDYNYINGRVETVKQTIGSVLQLHYRFSYYANGNVSTVTNLKTGKSSSLLTYDSIGQVKTGINSAGQNFSIDYYPGGMIKRKTIGSSITEYEYINGSLLKKVTIDGKLIELQYDDYYKMNGIKVNGVLISSWDPKTELGQGMQAFLLRFFIPEARAFGPVLGIAGQGLAGLGLIMAISATELIEMAYNTMVTWGELCKPKCRTKNKPEFTLKSWLNSVINAYISVGIQNFFHDLDEITMFYRTFEQFSIERAQYYTDMAIRTSKPRKSPRDSTVVIYNVRMESVVGFHLGQATRCMAVTVKKQCDDELNAFSMDINEVVNIRPDSPINCDDLVPVPDYSI